MLKFFLNIRAFWYVYIFILEYSNWNFDYIFFKLSYLRLLLAEIISTHCVVFDVLPYQNTRRLISQSFSIASFGSCILLLSKYIWNPLIKAKCNMDQKAIWIRVLYIDRKRGCSQATRIIWRSRLVQNTYSRRIIINLILD